MTTERTTPPGPHQAIASHTAASTPAWPPTVRAHGGWALRRLEVINDAAGVCARCGMTGADTVVRDRVDKRRTYWCVPPPHDSDRPIHPGPSSSTSASVHSSWRGTQPVTLKHTPL